MRVLLLVGAGTSVELGVPAMSGLAEEFIEHSKQWEIEPKLVQELLGDTRDIEHLIERLDQICTARDSLEAIGQNSDILDRADSVRAEVEWFVQHAAERVLPKAAHLLWGPVLRAASDLSLTIVSTNYDRAIELAANAEGIELEDGYSKFETGETAEWCGFSGVDSSSTLVKLHGSTDWYLEDNKGDPRKLRHPMPLFGKGVLKMPNGLELGSALILPSREKLLTRQPYPRLSQAFLNAADQCDLAVVIGSSLRDHHLRAAVKSMAERAPVFIVNRKGTTHGIEKVVGLPFAASAFLTGILPPALRVSNPSSVLAKAADFNSSHRNTNCLKPLAVALDVDMDEAARCSALDQLESIGIAIDDDWLKDLIQGTSPEVARYSLGFITLSPNAGALLDLARSCNHAREGSPFHEDLTLLESMI